jgi:hypothetical protein
LDTNTDLAPLIQVLPARRYRYPPPDQRHALLLTGILAELEIDAFPRRYLPFWLLLSMSRFPAHANLHCCLCIAWLVPEIPRPWMLSTPWQ